MNILDRYQVAVDVVRFASMMHDGVDACKHVANNVDPDHGFEADLPEGYEDNRIGFLQIRIRSFSNAVLVNHNALIDFITVIGVQEVKDSLSQVFGVNPDNVQTQIQNMRDVASYVYNNVLSLTTVEELPVIATYISTRVPQWKSIRRRWAL